MKKNISISIILLIISLLLSGCSNTLTDPHKSSTSPPYFSEQTQEESHPNDQITDSLIGKEPEIPIKPNQMINITLSSGVTMNSILSVPVNIDYSDLSSYNGSLQHLSINSIKERLLGTDYYESREEIKESRFQGAEYVFLEKADGTVLTCSEESISFFSPEIESLFTYFVPEYSTEYNGDAFLTDTDFSFATRQECLDDIISLLNSLDIDVSDRYMCYSLDYMTLMNEAEKYRKGLVERTEETGAKNENGTKMEEDEILAGLSEPNYSQDDNCYYFTLYAGVNGIPVTRVENGIFENGGLTPGSIIEAAYSKDGLQELYINSIYHILDKVHNGKGLNPEDAIELLDARYNSIILDGNYEVIEMSLEYVPISKGDRISVELVPAWHFCVKHTFEVSQKNFPSKTDTISQFEHVFINALSGEEILRDVGGI